MPTNARFVTPYFSTIKLVLFPGVTQVAVQDQQGRQGVQLVDEKPQVRTNITGWIDNTVVRSDNFVFSTESVVAADAIVYPVDVLEAAKQVGVDVAEAWSATFDQVAEEFAATKDQPAGSESAGPPVFLRADAFEANLNPTQKKSVTMKVGVYSDDSYTKLQTYIQLVFEDGETKRERETNLANLTSAKGQLETTLAALDALVAAREANAAVPSSFQYNEYILGQTLEQLHATRTQTAAELASRIQQIAQLSQVLNGDLSTLLGNSTSLHQTVMGSVGALCTAILLTLKQVNPDYADIDAAAIMAKFSTPDIS
jgi:hypothetical protein